MAVRKALTPFVSGTSASDDDAVIVAEGLSKRYPRRRVTLWPPVVQIFERGPFKRDRPSADAAATSASDAQALELGTPAPRRDDLGFGDLDDDDLDDDDDDLGDEGGPGPGAPTPDRPGEMFSALEDVSFRVPRGAALGVLGGPGAGKSTLLSILGGRAFPTDGRVLVHGRVSPLPAGLAKALSLTGKGVHRFSLVGACRLLGVEPHLVKRHLDEIEELAQPFLDAHGDPSPGGFTRLAVATAVVIPASVILLEDGLRGVDEALMERVVERVRERLRGGSSLVLASRKPELVEELCDEAIVLEEGSIVARGDAKTVAGRYQGAQRSGDKQAAGSWPGGSAADKVTPSQGFAQGGELRVPRVVPAFNESAALLSATLETSIGRHKQIQVATDEVSVEIRLETALPDIEAHCGVGFAPSNGAGTGIRLELPEPLRFIDPGSYLLRARVAPGALRTGVYEVRADATVSNPAEGDASVIVRDIGRVRIVGDERDGTRPPEPSVSHWDGGAWWRAEAEWSIE